jgi:hypothetical protein
MCAAPQPGVFLPPTLTPAWPAPLAYFPLTAGSLDSWPDAQYSGTNQGAQFALDSRFGSVLSCNSVSGWRLSHVAAAPRPTKALRASSSPLPEPPAAGCPSPTTLTHPHPPPYPPPQGWLSHATLDPVPYAASGPFAVNIWARLAQGALQGGGNYSYVFAHSGGAAVPFGAGPNHVSYLRWIRPVSWTARVDRGRGEHPFMACIHACTQQPAG